VLKERGRCIVRIVIVIVIAIVIAIVIVVKMLKDVTILWFIESVSIVTSVGDVLLLLLV